ncbi:hypothetical protein GPECTOR_157g98 [Gonium pectorale]|uniref:Uncharacterized protein n=1 Tax=Gonium pectorale TaxID=33097 RepID=A0A150FZ79_GONPE|nr:hypothetical protein GPECTOR_157g98 [Gonium pectorale]|eukprot:KXZ42360.1 hypothetical protein GPECTOR_157g98 [Gonium pectorale]
MPPHAATQPSTFRFHSYGLLRSAQRRPRAAVTVWASKRSKERGREASGGDGKRKRGIKELPEVIYRFTSGTSAVVIDTATGATSTIVLKQRPASNPVASFDDRDLDPASSSVVVPDRILPPRGGAAAHPLSSIDGDDHHHAPTSPTKADPRRGAGASSNGAPHTHTHGTGTGSNGANGAPDGSSSATADGGGGGGGGDDAAGLDAYGAALRSLEILCDPDSGHCRLTPSPGP